MLWVVFPKVPRVLLGTSMEMKKCEVRFHLYYILYTDRVTSPLFGNEQRRGDVRLYYILHTDRVTSPLFGNEQRRDEVRLYYILYTDRATSQLFGNEQRRDFSVCIYK